MSRPTPRIVAAPPVAADDFLADMSSPPTRHEARPLRHKKDDAVGIVAVAAVMIGVCVIAVILFAVYYANQPAGTPAGMSR